MTSRSDAATLVARRVIGSGQLAISKIGRRVYRVTGSTEDLVVKLFDPEEAQAFQHEVDGANAARILGRWVPPSLGAGIVGSGHHYVAYGEIAGTNLHHVVDQGELSTSEALHILGDVLRRFHHHTRQGFGPGTGGGELGGGAYMGALISERARLLARHELPELVAVLEGLAERWRSELPVGDQAVLCHGDLHLDNVIVTRSADGFRVNGVVDYESVVFAPAEFDLAKALVVCSAFGERDRQDLLAGYGREVNLRFLTDLLVFHTIDGWLWAAVVEGRDRRLWRERLEALPHSPGVPSFVLPTEGMRVQSPR